MSRPTKRARVVPAQGDRSSSSSAAATKREPLFAPFRSLGHVSTGMPLVVQSRASKYLDKPAITLITSLGRSWAMWDGHSMKLLFVGECTSINTIDWQTAADSETHPAGPDAGKELTSLAVLNESVFAAAGDSVIRYVRGKEIGRFVTRSSSFRRSGSASSSGSSSDTESSDAESSEEETDSSSSDSSDSSDDEDSDSASKGGELNNLLLFGNTLMALSSSGRRMYVWDVPPYVKPASKDPEAGAEAAEDEEEEEVTPYTTLEMPQGFTATKLVHPASYLNKVVVGSKEGELAVWNIRTG